MRPGPPWRSVPPFAPSIVATPSGVPSRGVGTKARSVIVRTFAISARHQKRAAHEQRPRPGALDAGRPPVELLGPLKC
jgi:hypothetical protein